MDDDVQPLLDRHYRQIEALTDLYNLLKPRAPMPPLRHWPASPDVLHTLIEIVWTNRPELIVECGSGSSSLWLGYAVERVGTGRVVALEHDEMYAQRTQDRLRMHGLHRLVDVRLAPLRKWTAGGEVWRWYSRSALRDLSDVGLIFVDGPPETTGPLARYPAVPELLPRCGRDVVIVLDDAARADESVISDRWIDEFSELERTIGRHEKGAHIFTRINS